MEKLVPFNIKQIDMNAVANHEWQPKIVTDEGFKVIIDWVAPESIRSSLYYPIFGRVEVIDKPTGLYTSVFWTEHGLTPYKFGNGKLICIDEFPNPLDWDAPSKLRVEPGYGYELVNVLKIDRDECIVKVLLLDKKGEHTIESYNLYGFPLYMRKPCIIQID